MSQPNFSTSNTTDADYSVNQQSSDMNGYNTGTDTDTSHQFHLSQTTANGLTDIPNVTYNHDRVPNLRNPGLYFSNFLSIQYTLDLRKPDLRKNLDLRKIVGATDFLVHKLFDLRKIF